jgi:hypothetical protein
MAAARKSSRLSCASAEDYLSSMNSHRTTAVAAALAGAIAMLADRLPAQASPPDTVSLSVASRSQPHSTPHYKLRFAVGFVTSILAHESGHIIAAYAVGGHPTFGFNRWRPTIYSGIDATIDPHKQFIFSSAGLTVQTLLDETLLDVPRARGSIAGPFERGLLAGGIGTVLFYITLGRTGSVSDVTFMANTSSLSKTQISLIYGGMAALHAVRIHFKDRYAHFFTVPDASGHLRVGMSLAPD